MTTVRAPRAIVIEGDTAYADGSRILRMPFTDPEYHMHHVLHGCAKLFGDRTEGIVLITNPLPDGVESIIRSYGWEFDRIRTVAEGGWTTFRRNGSPRIHMGIRSAIKIRDTPIFHPEESSGIIADRLATYHEVIGHAWRGMAGLPGHDLLRSLYAHLKDSEQPLWKHERPEAPNTPVLKGAGSPLWHLWKEQSFEALHSGWEYVHQFDTRVAYCAAAANVSLPYSKLRQSNMQFDKAYAGYWLVRASDVGIADDVIPVISSGRVWQDMVWLTTPIMTLIQDTGYTPEVLDAYVSLTDRRDGTHSWTRRILMPWANKIRDCIYDAESCDEQVLRDALKHTVARSISLLGHFGERGGRIYRPDWMDFVIDTSRANLIRKIRETLKQSPDVQLISVKTDAMFLLSNSPDKPYAYREGPKIGMLKYKGYTSLTSHIEGQR